MTPKRAKVSVGVVPHATPAELTGVVRDDEPTTDHRVPHRITVTRPAPADVVIGDRVHFSPPQGGGPWHGVVIANTAGVYTLEVVKPNGNHNIIVAAVGSEPGEFLLVT